MRARVFTNPFRPGAGHRPPYLAGREHERREFTALLAQTVITDNLVVTGLRGVGKTVLLEDLKPVALSDGWLWVGTDMSEAATVSETSLAHRLITDLSVVTAMVVVGETDRQQIGFVTPKKRELITLDYDTLLQIYERAPGLVIDKLKSLFLFVAPHIEASGKKGIIFTYDEAQNLSDQAQKEQYPLSLLLDLFQSVQRQNIRFMLVLSGLPTLYPKLIEARTYTERMFRVLFLKQLSKIETRDAIEKPVEETGCPVKFNMQAIDSIYRYSGGYPYFIQFICRESYDAYIQQSAMGRQPIVPIGGIIRKLDADFFAGRWSRVTDRQQELLFVIACIDNAGAAFSVQEIVSKSADILEKPFGRSHINQLLSSLISSGLIYRDRHGRYLFAVPLMGDFIKRVWATR